MQSKRLAKWASILVLLVVIAFIVYGYLNLAVSLDYARQQRKTDIATTNLLCDLVTSSYRGAHYSELKQSLEQQFGKDHIVKEDAHRLYLDNIVFQFDSADTLLKVHPIDDLENGE